MRMIKVSELTDDFNTHCFLGFDKFPVKEINQDIAFSRVQSVLPQLDDGTAGQRTASGSWSSTARREIGNQRSDVRER